METIILKLIGNLSTLLDCPNPWIERLSDYQPLPKETIETLDNELPNLLKYCKQHGINPEIKLLMGILTEVVNKYGTKGDGDISPIRYSGYDLCAFADTLIEIEETCQYNINKDLANSCKPWLYWLNQYYPFQDDGSTDQQRLEKVEIVEHDESDEPSSSADTPDLNEQSGSVEGLALPEELATPEAIKYLARAEELGMMERTDTGGKWKLKQVCLGYICSKVFQQPRPISALEKYFGVTKLSASITQASIEPTRADVKKWRADIDKTIFFD